MPRLLRGAAAGLLAVAALAGCGSAHVAVTTPQLPATTSTTTAAGATPTAVATTAVTETVGPTTTGTVTPPPSNTAAAGTATRTVTTTTAAQTTQTQLPGTTSAGGVVCPAGTVVRGLACETPDGHDAGVNPVQCPSGYQPLDGGCAPGSNTDAANTGQASNRASSGQGSAASAPPS